MTVTGQPRFAPHTQTQVTIKLNGAEISRELAQDLVEVRVDTGVRTIGRATLTFLDRTGSIAGGTLELGTEVTISSVEPAIAVFSGMVTGLDMEAGLTGTEVTATVQDKAYLLARNRSVATYGDQTYSEVVTTIAAAAGLRTSVTATTERVQWLLQVDSDLGLIDEIAGRLGLDWAVVDNTFGMWPSSGTAPWATERSSLELGVDLLSFAVRRADVGPTDVTVRGWDALQGRAVTSTATSATHQDGFKPPKGKAARVVAASEASSTAAGAETTAKGLAAAVGRVSGRGRATFQPQVRPGSVIAVRGVGAADGPYYVREVSHQVDAGSLRTSFVVGDRPPVRLTDPWASPAPFSSMRHSALTVGLVDNLKDPEGMERVRVQLAGLGTISSAWARVLSLGAGQNRGLVVLPEVGDEVLVAFEDGDVRRPVVLGGLFSKSFPTAGPAPVADGAVVSRHLVSGKGNRLELADGKTKQTEYVQMTLADDKHRLRIGKDKTELAAPGTPLTITSGDASITFDGRGNISIDAMSITLKAKQAVKLEGVEIAAKASATFEAAGARAIVNGSAQTVVKAGAVVEVTGALVKIN